MIVARSIAEVRELLRAARRAARVLGLVPTMGALHAGHASLIQAARADGCFVLVSIFVNPTQFGPHEDFSRYPRPESADLAACEAADADAVFLPSVGEMYPPESYTRVRVEHLTHHLCGPFRPRHFEGVATIVCKLFNIVQPDRAYFGQKDAQQLAVIRRMVRDLNFAIEIVGCPTRREPDGLALSSRNAYLAPAERAQAACLHQALQAARAAITAGALRPEPVLAQMRRIIEDAGPARIDYISIVDADTLQPLETLRPPLLIALAVHIGKTRLIDNVSIP